MKYTKKTAVLFLPLVAAFSLLYSCVKNDYLVPEGRLLLKAEKIDKKPKVAINGANASWVDGDAIRINNSTKTVSLDGSNATISSEGLEGPYRAIYPASLATDMDLTTGTATIELPDQYVYTEESGTQLLTLPMAAYSNGGSSLEFKHLTAALVVRLTNSFGSEMQVREILLQSDLSQISGSRTVDLSSTSAITSQAANDVNVTDKQKQVRMLFPSGMTIVDNGYRDVMIPVCPVSTNNKFTVTIVATNGSSCYTFSHTQQGGENNTDRSLERNQMGYVPVTMSSGGDHITSSTFVSTPEQYSAMAATINGATSGTKRYTISGTIDFTGYRGGYADTIDIKSNVTVIINGVNNATLRNLKVHDASSCCGLFKVRQNANLTISNLTVENIDLTGASDAQTCSIGGLISSSAGSTNLSYCTVRNAIFPSTLSASTDKKIGGLIGGTTTDCNLTVTNCSFEQEDEITMTVGGSTKTLYLGGIVGYSYASINTIDKCTVKAYGFNISPINSFNTDIGSIAGWLKNTSIITNCTIHGNSPNNHFLINVNSTTSGSDNRYTGGLVGYASNSTEGQTYSYNRLLISIIEEKNNNKKTWVGMIIGYAFNGGNGNGEKLFGVNNNINNCSVTLNGNGTNTYCAYHYTIGEIGSAPFDIPINFFIGTVTFTNNRAIK